MRFIRCIVCTISDELNICITEVPKLYKHTYINSLTNGVCKTTF